MDPPLLPPYSSTMQTLPKFVVLPCARCNVAVQADVERTVHAHTGCSHREGLPSGSLAFLVKVPTASVNRPTLFASQDPASWPEDFGVDVGHGTSLHGFSTASILISY